MTDLSFKEALLTPGKHYEQPSDVTNDGRWSKEQKREILQAWKSNEAALLRGSGEGLDGGERPQMRQVAAELEKLSES